MESSQEGMQVKLESSAEKLLKQHVLILEHLLEGAELQWKEANNELKHVPAEEKMTRDGRSSAFLASKMELVRSKAKLECLVERMKSVKDEGKLESQRWKMRLSKNIQKAEFALQEMKWMPGEEGVEALGLDIMQVEEQIAKSKLLLEEMELIQHVKKGKFPFGLYFSEELKEHIVKVESLLENMKEESKIEFPMLRIQLKEDKLELESLLKQMKLVEESGIVWSSTLALPMQFEVHIMKLKLLLDGTELEEEKEGLGSEMLEKPISGEPIAKSKFFPKQGEKKRLRSPVLEKPSARKLVTKSEFVPKQGEKGLGSPILEKPLSEKLVAKSEFFPKQEEKKRLRSPMLEKPSARKLVTKSEFFPKQGEKEGLGSPMLEKLLSEKLVAKSEFFPKQEEKKRLRSPMLEKPSARKLVTKSEFFPKQGEKEGLGSPMLEKPLSEKLVAKSEFFPKQEEKKRLRSPMLEKPSARKLVTKSEFFPKQGEKEGLVSPMLEKLLWEELIAKLEFFPKQGEKGLRSQMLEKPFSEELIAKSEFFPKQGEKKRLGSQMLEKALLEELITKSEFFLEQGEEERLWSQMLEKPLSEKLITKSEFFLKQGLILEHLQKISSILRKIRSEQYLKSPALGMQYKELIVELEGELKKLELENVKDQLKFRKLKVTSCSQRVEMERLQEKIKIELKEGLQSQALKIDMNEDITKLELSLEETEFEERHVAELKRFIAKAKEMNLVREERTMESLMLQLKKRTVQLKSLLKEMELVQWFEKTWYMNFETYVGGLESLLKGMGLKQIGQRLPPQAFEIQLNEHIVKLEMLVKEIESTRDVNVLELKGHLGKLKSLLEATKLGQDELEFSALEMQLKEHITQMEFKRETERIKLSLKMQLEEHIEELSSLHEKIKLVQWAGELKCKPLEMELNRHKMELESLVDKMNRRGQIPMSEEKFQRESKSLLKKIESKRDVEILSILMLKMELEGHSAKWRYLLDELMKLEKERKLKSTTLGNEFKQHIAKLKSLLVEMKLEQKEKTVGSGALQMELEEHIVKSELLLEVRELRYDVIMLKSTMSKIQFKERLKEVEHRLWIMNLGRDERKLKFSALQEVIVKLISLLEEMKSKEKEVKLESSTIKLEHEEGKLESSTEGRQLTPREQKATIPLMAQQKWVKLESSTVQVKLEEHIVKLEALLEKMKLEPKEEKLEPSPKRIPLEQEEGKMESSTEERKLAPQEQKATSPLIAQRPIIIIGGRGQDGQSLTSVEGYIFLEGKWIELPAMNTPRSFMSSVVIGSEIVVSGGDTGDAITDTIEVLNLAETPLQWKLSPARLPVPLSAHQTVVFEGKLIVIGGHDFNEGRNSDKIYEVLLTPPYTSRILRTLVTPVAWHGAELVGHEIFIFGGGRTSAVPSSAVFSYSPGSDRLYDEQPLPSAVMGMATASKGRRVAVIGGLDDNEQELNAVFTYPIRAGELHALPQMNERRGGCSAVISLTLERGGSCSSETFTDALFALGSVRSISTVEGYSFESHRWIDMPPMREPRGFCSMVVAPIEFQYE